MKKAILISLISFFIVAGSTAQIDSIKNYSLRDYIAPDIKYQRLDFYTGLNLNGNRRTSDENENKFRTHLRLNYYEYMNLSRFQGISDAYFRTSLSSSWSGKDTLKTTDTDINIDLDYFGQNRIYYSNQTFWGIHGQAGYYYSPSFMKRNDEVVKHQYHSFTITPYISFGKGRIQPVESARQALDILIALQQNNRLSKKVVKQTIDSLARVGNRIRYKRFYDLRFKRIYQLEELDRVIQDLGLVDSLDIVYFANLSDIWDYAGNYKRGSGLRFEGGFIPDVVLSRGLYQEEGEEDEKSDYNSLGIYGFFSINRMRPISYAWQSDLMMDLTFGYSKTSHSSTGGSNTSSSEQEYIGGMLNMSWHFGFYPNTRTYAGLTPFITATYLDRKGWSTDNWGIGSGLKFQSYYYVSPRFRLSFDAGFIYADNFNWAVPAPFWNTVSHNNYFLGNTTNDNIAFPVDGTADFLYYGIEYYFTFSLRYAIF